MTKHHDLGLYFLSLLITLLLFGFGAALLAVGAEGARSQEELFSVTHTDRLHTEVEVFGSEIQLDYTPLTKPERIRRDYAPLLTPRLALTAEYAAGYASYWGKIFRDNLKEYLFAREAYGADAVRVDAQEATGEER